MRDGLRLSSEPNAPAEQKAAIVDAIDRWNMEITGDHDYHQVAIFVRDDAGEVRGGVTGGVWGEWLHVVGLWVDEPIRGLGLGRDLVLCARRPDTPARGRHLPWLDPPAPSFATSA